MVTTSQISIHALRKESDYVTRGHIGVANISIHALRKESDNVANSNAALQRISIHALRKESDVRIDVFILLARYFNPRSP